MKVKARATTTNDALQETMGPGKSRPLSSITRLHDETSHRNIRPAHRHRGQNRQRQDLHRQGRVLRPVLDELVRKGLITCTPRNHLPDCPLDYTAEPHAYELAKTISRADVERGNFVAMKE